MLAPAIALLHVERKSGKLSVILPTGVNIKKHSDRLDVLLARYDQQIRETEDKLRALKTGRNNLNLLAQEPNQPETPRPEPAKFLDTGITKSVLDTISDLWRFRKDAVTLTED